LHVYMVPSIDGVHHLVMLNLGGFTCISSRSMENRFFLNQNFIIDIYIT